MLEQSNPKPETSMMDAFVIEITSHINVLKTNMNRIDRTIDKISCVPKDAVCKEQIQPGPPMDLIGKFDVIIKDIGDMARHSNVQADTLSKLIG